jgi:hypothetical protein
VQAPLRYGEGGIPSQADVQAAEVPPRHLVGGGPSAPLRIAKAMMVSLIDDGATDVAARRAGCLQALVGRLAEMCVSSSCIFGVSTM